MPIAKRILRYAVLVGISVGLGAGVIFAVYEWQFHKETQSLLKPYGSPSLPSPVPLPVSGPMQIVPPFPPIAETDFSFVSADEAKGKIDGAELVLGVVIDGEARAYPLNMLSIVSQQILNDTVGGRPIAVTWSPFCHSGIVYSGEVVGQTLTFSNAGSVWAGNLVMLDKETESRWCQLLGEAMEGAHKGEVLEPLPSLMTDWKTWKTKHPETTVVMLEKKVKKYRRELYRKRGLTEFVIGLMQGDQSRAWGFEQLHEHPVINDTLADRSLLVLFDGRSSTASLFDRNLDGKVLTFERRGGKLMDRETGSTWDSFHGRSVAGPNEGKQLTPLPGIVSFTDGWIGFHPGTTIWSPDDKNAG